MVRLQQIRKFAVAMAFSLLILLTGCSDKMTNVERGNRDKEFYIGLGTEPATLDPHLLTGLTELYVLIAFIEGLTTYNAEDMSILPGVAQSWDISEDGLIYTFHFDPEARWSNGDRVTPQDFLFSFERILTPALGAPYASMLYPMKGAEAFNTGQTSDFSTVGVSAPDDGTLIIELESQTPYFLSILTHNAWWPVHPPTILKHGKMTDRLSKWTRPENFVGNGPFAIDSWRLNSALSGKRNPYYRAPENVGLNGIHFLPIETNAEERAFRAGQLHVTENIPIHRLDWYRENKPENMRIETTLGVYYYLVNVETEALSDKRIRQALAYTINREEIADYVLKAGQQPAYHFTPPNAGGYNARARLPYDPELARKLIAEAGYPGGEGFPKIELLYNTSEAHRAIAVAIQQMWKEELGIEIELYNQEWKAYLATRQEGSFQMCRAAWFGDYDDPNTFLSLAKTGDGNNHSNWSHPEFDRLLDEAARTADSEARKEVFQQAEEILIEEMPFIPIYFYVTTKLVHESVRGWYPSILDYHPYQAITLETN